MLRGLIGFALAAGLSLSNAQAQEVAGTWTVDFDRLVTRTADGRDSVAARGKAQLVIRVKGDSALGTWTIEGPGGQPRKLRGTRKGNAVKLVSDALPGTVHINGKITEMPFINTYEATVTGDAIVGTITAQAQNGQLPATGPRVRKFDGKRESGSLDEIDGATRLPVSN